MNFSRTKILMIRHAETSWNAEKRIQGRTDVRLSDIGRTKAGSHELPLRFSQWKWVVSPLKRTQETALLMGAENLVTVPAIIEMNWGDWEGETLTSLRRRFPAEMKRRERNGLDFRPPMGESPRDVQHRLQGWVKEINQVSSGYVVVTHKGVIRVALSLATHWDMVEKPPIKMDWDCAHLFETTEQNSLRLIEPNIPMG